MQVAQFPVGDDGEKRGDLAGWIDRAGDEGARRLAVRAVGKGDQEGGQTVDDPDLEGRGDATDLDQALIEEDHPIAADEGELGDVSAEQLGEGSGVAADDRSEEGLEGGPGALLELGG